MARKPRDWNSELQALTEKAKKLRTQKTVQLGELVQATDADALTVEALAGALLEIVAESKSPASLARWTEQGNTFFQDGKRQAKKVATRKAAA